MATLSLVGGSGQFAWTISGLSNWFASNQYRAAGVATQEFSGGTTSISGIIARVNATTDPPDPSNPFSVSGTATYASGTYTLYGFAQGSDGTYWPAGTAEVTISSSGGVISRWDWSSNDANLTAYQILQGMLPSSAGFQASVWNAFVNKVSSAYREWYDGEYGSWDEGWRGTQYGTYQSRSGCRVSSGDSLSADIFNSVRWNVTMIPCSSKVDWVSPGDELTGNHILGLVDMLNEGIDEINAYG